MTIPQGPIAKKLVQRLWRLKQEKLVDLEAWKAGRSEARHIHASDAPSPEYAREYPEAAAYTLVTNWVLGQLELMQGLPELKKFYREVQAAEEEYMPSGPPMSPLTRSYFWHWILYDFPIGPAREQFGAILHAIGSALEMDSTFLGLLATLVTSRMGVFARTGRSGKGRPIGLRELITCEKHEALCPAGHVGEEGEPWLVRVLPPPSSESRGGVVPITPYRLIAPAASEWEAYFGRTLPSGAEQAVAYREHMKVGPSPRFWPEFIFEGYVNHEPDVIVLAGLPDIPQSRPHSSANSGKRMYAR
jgi:hypothetical protein